MHRFALILLIACAPACFNDHVPPPTFRFACDNDDDCEGGEECIDDLCQLPCTQRTTDEDCPPSRGYAGCVNGVCANICQPSDEGNVCPKPQECLDLGISVDQEGAFGGSTSTEIGLCMAKCEEGSCPEGEICVEGLCTLACTETADCPEEQICVMGVCVPEEITEERLPRGGDAPAREHT